LLTAACGEVGTTCGGGWVALNARPECFRRRGEPHEEPTGVQDLPVRFAQYCPAAGGNHTTASRTQFGNRRGFAVAKTDFAFGHEDFGDGFPGDGFDTVVGVGETPAELLREALPGRGFTGATRADENDVGRHGVLVFEGERGRKPPDEVECK